VAEALVFVVGRAFLCRAEPLAVHKGSVKKRCRCRLILSTVWYTFLYKEVWRIGWCIKTMKKDDFL